VKELKRLTESVVLLFALIYTFDHICHLAHQVGSLPLPLLDRLGQLASGLFELLSLRGNFKLELPRETIKRLYIF
jgi:hypothetical protein